MQLKQGCLQWIGWFITRCEVLALINLVCPHGYLPYPSRVCPFESGVTAAIEVVQVSSNIIASASKNEILRRYIPKGRNCC